jgi:hypothetical protein
MGVQEKLMYTQSFNVPDGPENQAESAKGSVLKAVPQPLTAAQVALQAQFDQRIDADG